jgi:hypothetical protein
METIYSNSRIGHENQLIYLDTERLIGVQSVSLTNNYGLSPVSYVGIGSKELNDIPNSELSSTFNLSTYLINKDYFWNLTTGNGSTDMFILRSVTDRASTYSILSGYFTDFSCRYSIGNVPEISTTFTSLSNAGPIPSSEIPADTNAKLLIIALSNPSITGNLAIPFGNSISLGIADFTTNRVQSFTLSAQSSKIPVYNMGIKTAQKIEHQSTKIFLDVSFTMSTYQMNILRSGGSINGVIRSLNLIAGDYSNTGNIVAQYKINNLVLTNEAYSAEVNGDVLVSQSYSSKIYPA